MTCYQAQKNLDMDPRELPGVEMLATIDHLRTCKQSCKPIYLKRLRNGIQMMIDAANNKNAPKLVGRE